MKRAIMWTLCILLILFAVRAIAVSGVSDGALNEFNRLGSVSSSFSQVKLESVNNALTKYTASLKALDILKSSYGGHHFIQRAEYSRQHHAWYLVARDIDPAQFFRKVFALDLRGPLYYVVLPDGEAFAEVLGVK